MIRVATMPQPFVIVVLVVVVGGVADVTGCLLYTSPSPRD